MAIGTTHLLVRDFVPIAIGTWGVLAILDFILVHTTALECVAIGGEVLSRGADKNLILEHAHFMAISAESALTLGNF